MKYIFFGIVFFLASISSLGFAGCYVQDGTFYSNSKYNMISFAQKMEQGKKQAALEMIDHGRISSCSRAPCVVLKRDRGFVKTRIMGIGTVWIYESFLRCY